MTDHKKDKRKRPYRMHRRSLDNLIDQLVSQVEDSHEDAAFLKEMIVTTLKIAEDDIGRGDVKMINTAMKELRYALKIFYPYSHIRKAAIFGSARTPQKNKDYIQAREFSRLMAKEGWMVITGAASGIMHAGNEGAGREHSFGVNIRLPFEQAANSVILGDPKLINFKYFFTRKLIFVAESDATVLCPGGFGTHDEGFETLTLVQTGKATPRPIVCLDPAGSHYWKNWLQFLKHMASRKMIDKEDLKLVDHTHSAEEAVQIITDFYRNYHSMRYIGDMLVIRLKKALPPASLKRINKDFKDILKKGTIRQQVHSFEEETNEPHTYGLTRLVLYFDRRHYARLHQLVKATNVL